MSTSIPRDYIWIYIIYDDFLREDGGADVYYLDF